MALAICAGLYTYRATSAKFDDLAALSGFASGDKTIYYDVETVDTIGVDTGVRFLDASKIKPVSMRTMSVRGISKRELLRWLDRVAANRGWKTSDRIPGQITVAPMGMTGTGMNFAFSAVDVKLPKGVDLKKLGDSDLVNVSVVDTERLSSRDLLWVRLMHFGRIPYEKI